MEGSDISWAMEALDDRLADLADALPRLRTQEGIDPEVLEQVEKENRELSGRQHELMASLIKGHEIDLHPEFELLCWQIKQLQRQKMRLLFTSCVVHGSLAVTNVTLVTIARCIASVEIAIAALLYGVFSTATTSVRSSWHDYVSESNKIKNRTLEKKVSAMRQIVRTNNDIRYVHTGIEAFGLREFQDMRHT